MSARRSDMDSNAKNGPAEIFDLLSLDFDGVLHPTGLARWDGTSFECPGAFQWWEPIEEALLEIEKETGVPVKTAVHSTWRLMFEKDSELLALAPRSLKARFIGCAERSIGSRGAALEQFAPAAAARRLAAMDDEPEAFGRASSAPPWVIACNGSDRGGSHPGALAKLRRLLTAAEAARF